MFLYPFKDIGTLTPLLDMVYVYVCVFLSVQGFVGASQIDFYTIPITYVLPFTLVWSMFNKAVNMHSKKQSCVNSPV